MKTVQGVREIS